MDRRIITRSNCVLRVYKKEAKNLRQNNKYAKAKVALKPGVGGASDVAVSSPSWGEEPSHPKGGGTSATAAAAANSSGNGSLYWQR